MGYSGMYSIPCAREKGNPLIRTTRSPLYLIVLRVDVAM